MKNNIKNTIKLLAAAIALIGFAQYAKAEAVNSNNNQLTNQINASQNNVGNKQEWNTTGSNNGNKTITENNQKITDSYNQINNSRQTIDNSYTKIDQKGIIGNDNEVYSGVNAGGEVKANANANAEGGEGGKAISSANGGSGGAASSSASGNGGASSVQTGSTNVAYNSNYRNYTSAPNLPMLIGMVSSNANACKFQQGGSATGSNGMASGGISLLLGFDDDNCEMWQRANFLISVGHYVGACKLIARFDREERDGYFNQTINEIGGCEAFIVSAETQAPIKTALARDTEAKLDSLKPINPTLDAAHKDSMTK